MGFLNNILSSEKPAPKKTPEVKIREEDLVVTNPAVEKIIQKANPVASIDDIKRSMQEAAMAHVKLKSGDGEVSAPEVIIPEPVKLETPIETKLETIVIPEFANENKVGAPIESVEQHMENNSGIPERDLVTNFLPEIIELGKVAEEYKNLEQEKAVLVKKAEKEKAEYEEVARYLKDNSPSLEKFIAHKMNNRPRLNEKSNLILDANTGYATTLDEEQNEIEKVTRAETNKVNVNLNEKRAQLKKRNDNIGPEHRDRIMNTIRFMEMKAKNTEKIEGISLQINNEIRTAVTKKVIEDPKFMKNLVENGSHSVDILMRVFSNENSPVASNQKAA